MRTVSEILSIRVNSNQQKYALHFLHRMTSSGMFVLRLLNESLSKDYM